jgi:small subunit ribosomal protein S17
MAEENENTENVEATEAPEAPAAVVEETKAEPEPVLAPKERKARSKAAKAKKTPVKQPLTPAEKHDARLVERKQKAAARSTGRAQSREKAKARAHQASVTPPRPHEEGIQKQRQGVVVSDKAAKTITVRLDVARRHRRYAKIVRTSSTVHAHDESGDAHIGDTVVVRECRPMSRTKRWRLVEVVERAK